MLTVKFFTVGCKVNQYETQVIREQFKITGFKEIDNHLPSDIYVINTCTVTHKADSDSFRIIRQAKRENPQAKIIVTGCLTELDENKIKKIEEKSLIVKNKDKYRILELLNFSDYKLITHNFPFISYFKGHCRAFLKIQDGCDNFCSYCKVPLVRGRSKSRPLNEVIQEVKTLVKNNYKEIVLCGICLGAYGKDLSPQLNLVNVIEELEKISGLLRIRLSSIEAADVSEELICKINQSKKLCRHLHIPLQSGCDEILKKMNRKYTHTDYLNLIYKIKKQIPEIAITTDILVGFPEETEEDFQDTVNLIKEILPLKVHIFSYSKRKETKAANLKELSFKVIKERINHLKNIAEECAFKYKEQFLDKKMDVLIENHFKEDLMLWKGYTDNYIKVLVKSNKNLKNQLIPLKLKKIEKDYIVGEL